MKVLWITSAYPSDSQPGSGVFHETQVQALHRLGVDVTVICPVPRSPAFIRPFRNVDKVNQDIPSKYERKGVMVYRPYYLALPGQLRWAQPDKRIAAVIMKTLIDYELAPDLIHAHFAMPSGGAARIVAAEKKLPWMLTLHGSDVNVYPFYSSFSKKAFLQSVRTADSVVAVAGDLQRKTIELAGRESLVLPIGIDLSQFQQPDQTGQQMRRQLGLPEDKKIITFVGRLTEAKGVFELARALDFLSNEIAILFVGDGPAKEKLSKNPEFNSRLFITGQVDNMRVRDYLFASDVFALPSYTEGMPTVVLEAIALKIPVICTAVGGVPDLFGEHRDLLIEPKSVSSLVQRIQDILNRNLYTPRILRDLYEQVQKNYYSHTNAVQLKENYRSLLN
ncbi:teichuronic acid biosynthesis protein TuaC [Neobacillus niacini]|uniref:teichuronic acid biosynthesis protein TuaC n=1 Tax=Neobacillus niacini TaxID=86668 RepID=UPI0028555AD2|nr:glycosyltransferase family 4 protein [Neobacillus niacini]MDR6999063.1 teichuronic acid biosynthesis glycosyltransferase TuaC [Neobacillus niacini]